MDAYETLLRKIFPALYDAALGLYDEEKAAWLAQLAVLRAYRDIHS